MKRNQKQVFPNHFKRSSSFIENVFYSIKIASIKEEGANTNENKLNEVEDHEKNDQNKLSICVVLFLSFCYSDFLFWFENENNHLRIVFE